MKKIKLLSGIFLLAGIFTVSALSLDKSNNTSSDNAWLQLKKKTCPNGMSGYRCIWTNSSGPLCPDPSRYPIGVWRCVTRG